VSTVVDAYQTEFVRQVTLVLFGPGHVALGETMDKQDGFTVGLAVFVYGELQSTTRYGVYRHGPSSISPWILNVDEEAILS
jgi:hypothetical protein